MRQTGYYFVEYKGKTEIAEFKSEILGEGKPWERTRERWQTVGSIHMPALQDTNFTRISPTPITPEKMAAIESIIDTISKVDSAVDKYFDIKDILNKHGLLPQPEKPKAAYYKGKKLRAVFRIPDETKYEIFVPHRIQVDKSEIEWKEISNQNTN